MVRFTVDHTLFLNLIFLVVAAALLWLHFRGGRPSGPEKKGRRSHSVRPAEGSIAT